MSRRRRKNAVASLCHYERLGKAELRMVKNWARRCGSSTVVSVRSLIRTECEIRRMRKRILRLPFGSFAVPLIRKIYPSLHAKEPVRV